MKPSQPDDAGSPSHGQPRPGDKPAPPAVVYALDCLERSTPAQVKRHLIAMGYTPDEAVDAIRRAHDHQEAERPSAWAPEDTVARRCMSIGFILLMLMIGIVAGCLRVYLTPHLPGGVPVVLNVLIWICPLSAIAIFALGVIHKGIRRP